ncbi:MAG: NUDIX domain-containing protein, partial [Candidatus Magasanikbacteria bacterium]|nr:NUDIX domain-containing protein [Candidatus Magasanikbacteria bacterium]
LSAARREISEESGITQLDFVRELGRYQRYSMNKVGGDDLREYKAIIIFLFDTAQETLCPRDPHNPEARWVEMDAVADLLTHPKDKNFFLSIKESL